MKAMEIVLPGIGDPESLAVRTRDLARPGPGQVMVRVEACGVSFAEQQMRRGKYYDQPAFPFVPGSVLSTRLCLWPPSALCSPHPAGRKRPLRPAAVNRRRKR